MYQSRHSINKLCNKSDEQFSLSQISNLAKRWRVSCKPRMRSADSIPIMSTSVCFLPLEMYTGITNKFEYKTDFFTIMIYRDIWLHFQNLSGLCHPIQNLRILAFILFISRSISKWTGYQQTSRQFSCVIVPSTSN